MDRLLAVVLALVAAFAPAHAAIEVWDGLPAFDPLHLQGAYAGTRVCPMCRHGYDAGIVLFVPVSTAPEALRGLAAGVLAAMPEREARFRGFLVLTGGTPSTAQLEATADAHPRWYVVQLAGEALQEAEAAFGRPLTDHAWGYVFAQRRLLRTLDADALLAAGGAQALRTDARYATRFLAEMHPDAVADADPDTPKGMLWAAPKRLGSSIELSDAGDARQQRVCFTGYGGQPLAGALVTLTRDRRPHWARSDAEGCIGLHAARPADGSVHVQLSLPRQATRALTIPMARLAPTGTTVLTVPPPPHGRERLVGGPCDGCEAVFDGLPANIGAQLRLGDHDERGAPLRIEGTVRDEDGAPAPGIVLYAYQTDHAGSYPRDPSLSGAAARHGRLRGWVRTDAAGRYRIDTVRPGAYPGREDPAHVHMQVIEPARCSYYIDDIVFEDDPRLTPAHRTRPDTARGGSGVTRPRGDGDGRWRVERDIELGRNVPGYGGCASTQGSRTAR